MPQLGFNQDALEFAKKQLGTMSKHSEDYRLVKANMHEGKVLLDIQRENKIRAEIQAEEALARFKERVDESSAGGRQEVEAKIDLDQALAGLNKDLAELMTLPFQGNNNPKTIVNSLLCEKLLDLGFDRDELKNRFDEYEVLYGEGVRQARMAFAEARKGNFEPLESFCANRRYKNSGIDKVLIFILAQEPDKFNPEFDFKIIKLLIDSDILDDLSVIDQVLGIFYSHGETHEAGIIADIAGKKGFGQKNDWDYENVIREGKIAGHVLELVSEGLFHFDRQDIDKATHDQIVQYAKTQTKTKEILDKYIKRLERFTVQANLSEKRNIDLDKLWRGLNQDLTGLSNYGDEGVQQEIFVRSVVASHLIEQGIGRFDLPFSSMCSERGYWLSKARQYLEKGVATFLAEFPKEFLREQNIGSGNLSYELIYLILYKSPNISDGTKSEILSRLIEVGLINYAGVVECYAYFDNHDKAGLASNMAITASRSGNFSRDFDICIQKDSQVKSLILKFQEEGLIVFPDWVEKDGDLKNTIIREATASVKGQKILEKYLRQIGEQEPKPALAETDQYKFDLLNIVHQAKPEEIRKFDQEITERQKTEKQTASVGMEYTIQSGIAERPKEWLNAFRSTVETDPAGTADDLMERLFPIWAKKQKEQREQKERTRGVGGWFGFGGGRSEGGPGIGQASAEDYLRYEDSSDLQDGDPLWQSREPVAELSSDALNGQMVITRILGQHEQGQWRHIDVALSRSETSGSSERRIGVTLPKAPTGWVNLLAPVQGEIQNIKGPVGDTDVLKTGEVHVELSQPGPLNYEIVVGENGNKLFPVEASDYKAMLVAMDERHLQPLTETQSTGVLPPLLKKFIHEIKDFPPHLKVAKIQEFVRTIGYYDFENKGMMTKKAGKILPARLRVMEQRMHELRRLDDLPTEQSFHKQYAGVCADFAYLTTVLLREAGLAAGVVEGFQVNGQTITPSQAHAVSFVLWPSGGDQPTLVLVDGTPGGLTPREQELLAQIQLADVEADPSLAEKYEEKKQQLIESKTVEMLKKVAERIEQRSPDAKLSQEELDGLLAELDQIKLTETEVDAIEALVTLPYYSIGSLPERLKNLADPSVAEEFRQVFSRHLANQTQPSSKRESSAKNLALFVERYVSEDLVKNGKIDKPQQAIEMFGRVKQMVGNDIDEISNRVFESILFYLRHKV